MDAANGADQGAAQPKDAERNAPQPGDAELAALIRSVDEGQVRRMPVTLMVGGTRISGELVSGAQWWERMSQLARRTEGDDACEQFAAGADSVSQLYRSADVTERRPVGYLHLQDVLTDGGRRAAWRIRMEEVQAWRWGR
jgi:hypothetical protein